MAPVGPFELGHGEGVFDQVSLLSNLWPLDDAAAAPGSTWWTSGLGRKRKSFGPEVTGRTTDQDLLALQRVRRSCDLLGPSRDKTFLCESDFAKHHDWAGWVVLKASNRLSRHRLKETESHK